MNTPIKTLWLFGLSLGLMSGCAGGEAKTAGLGPDENRIVALLLSPSAATVEVGQTVLVRAGGRTAAGAIVPVAVEWTATGGNIIPVSDFEAQFSATVPGTYWTRAQDLSAPDVVDSASVTVVAPAAPTVSLNVSPASTSLSTGGSRQFSASASRADGSSYVPSVVWSATGGGVSSSGLYTAGSTAGTFQVIATQQGGTLADTSAVTLATPPPPPPPGPNPNEPAGYVQRINESFTAAPSTPASQVNDPSAPVSAPLVARVTFPVGFAAGHSPWTREWNLPSNKPTGLYYRIAFKHSTNFYGHSSQTNKLGFVWIHGSPSVFLSAEGSGSGNLIAEFRLQGVPDGRGRLMPNRGASGIITRGNWHTWEVQIISNTPGIANGVARWWLDGVLVGEYTDVQFASATQANGWEIVSLNPIWGGVGGTVSNTMSIDFDNLYVSAPE